MKKEIVEVEVVETEAIKPRVVYTKEMKSKVLDNFELGLTIVFIIIVCVVAMICVFKTLI